MYTYNTPQSFQAYDEIARLERSKAFHAGIAWIVSLFKFRRTATPRIAAQAC